MTLSLWVRDYVFVPAGRTLFGTFLRPWPGIIATVSYLVTFLVSARGTARRARSSHGALTMASSCQSTM